jgi:plastocyanin
VRLRNLLLVSLCGLGVVTAVLPALASSETNPEVNAIGIGPGYYGESYAWSPTQTTVAAGGTVKFSTGTTAAPHGIVWTSSVKPTCSSTVPVGENNDAEHWSGTCTFAQAGTYTFHCSVHAEMTGTITVSAAGGTTTTMTSTAAGTTPTTPTSPPATVAPPTHLTPTPSSHTTTNAKKLAKALKACRKKPKGKRATCARKARRRYGPKRK